MKDVDIGNAGFPIAMEVCKMVESRQKDLIKCMRGLKTGTDGKDCLAGGDASGALPLLQSAHNIFESIPEARSLLGIIKGDLSAAYGKLGQYRRSADYAEDCISIIEGEKRLVFSEAMVRMTLATSLGMLGQKGDSEREFEKAEKIIKGFPDPGRYLKTLETNRRVVSNLSSITKTKSIFYRNFGIIATILAIAAIIYFFKF